jgi:hypothetical protein
MEGIAKNRNSTKKTGRTLAILSLASKTWWTGQRRATQGKNLSGIASLCGTASRTTRGKN